jgi:hypothetical protein
MHSGFLSKLRGSTYLEIKIRENVLHFSPSVKISGSSLKECFHHIEELIIFLLINPWVFDNQASELLE